MRTTFTGITLCNILLFQNPISATFQGADNDDIYNNSREFSIMLAGLGLVNNQELASLDNQWAVARPWAKDYLAVSATWEASSEEIRGTLDLGWSVVLTAWGSSFWRENSPNDSGEVANLTTAVTAMLNAGLSEDGIIWEYICEDDSAGVAFPQQLLEQARAAGYTNGATKLTTTEAMKWWVSYIEEAWGNTQTWPRVQRHARAGFPATLHSLAPYADLLLVERTNDDVGSLAPSLAFLRGAARQYSSESKEASAAQSKAWGVDFSLWWGVINGCVHDLPASTHRRSMFVSYVAGASTVSVEGCGWVDPSTGDPWPLSSEVGQEPLT